MTLNKKLNVGKILSRSRANGPGVRFVIWLQGCSRKCDGCINPQFFSHEPHKVLTVDEVFNLIVNTKNIEGVTFTGGEPFEQAEALYYLSKLIKESKLTIMSYSGFTYDDLKSDENIYIQKLISSLDLLVDGEYLESEKCPLLWRSSKNQAVHFLTGSYANYKDRINTKSVSIEANISEKMVITGNFDENILYKILNKLEKDHGIILKESNSEVNGE